MIKNLPVLYLIHSHSYCLATSSITLEDIISKIIFHHFLFLKTCFVITAVIISQFITLPLGLTNHILSTSPSNIIPKSDFSSFTFWTNCE